MKAYFLLAAMALLPVCRALPIEAQTAVAQDTQLILDPGATSTPFPHFWEEMFGSGRAILTLRESYRNDLRAVHQATGFRYVRFHGIFMDEAGFFTLDPKTGKPIYNFNYIDQIYDGLLANGVKPFVELSFMPKDLASNPAALHAFWYKQNVSPPKDYSLWDDMIRQFAQHLIDRYGAAEVAQWYFEVWNEPNIDFWVGTPKQPTYFELYDHTARALKQVSPGLRVGGPATAQAAWASDFLAYCKKNNVPVDFVSSHVYANDTARDVFHTTENIPRRTMVCRSVKMVHDEIAASPYPNLPFILSEYNASYANEPDVTDTTYMGPWLAGTIAQCDGLTSMMSYWTFSDVFEEQGIIKSPFYGGFGIMAIDGIPKPAFNAFAALHHLGDRRLPLSSDSALLTKRADGTLVLALWNYAPPNGTGATYTAPGSPAPDRHFLLRLKGSSGQAHATLFRVDRSHGNVIKPYDAMGRPADLSLSQIKQLRLAGQAAEPESENFHNGALTVDVPSHGLVVLEIH